MAVTQVIIFDLDGTLVDTAGDLAFAVNGVLTGRGLQPLPLDRILPLIGEGARRLVARALVAGGDEGAADIDAVLQEFLDLYAANLTRSTRAYPGVPETLELLAKEGYRLAVCTNKPERHSRAILDRLGLSDRIGVLVGGDSVPGVRKPDPRILVPVFDALATTPRGKLYWSATASRMWLWPALPGCRLSSAPAAIRRCPPSSLAPTS